MCIPYERIIVYFDEKRRSRYAPSVSPIPINRPPFTRRRTRTPPSTRTVSGTPRPPRPAPLTPKPSRRTAITQGEAAKKGGLLNTLLKVAPWKITGPASGPEWQEVPIGAEDYRVVAPACVPPRSLFLPPRALPWSSASPKRFSRKSRSRARSCFFATSPKDDIILIIKNHPSSSVSSLCSQ